MMEHDHAAEWMSEVRRGKALGELVAAAKVIDTDGNEVVLALLNNDGTLADPADDELDDLTEGEADALADAEEIVEEEAEALADAEDATEAEKKSATKKTQED